MFWGDPELQGLHVGIFIALAALRRLLGAPQPHDAGYEVRAVGFNPEAARYGGITRRPQLHPRDGDLRRCSPGSPASLDMLGWQFRIATNDIQVSQIGFLGIAVALLGRNTAIGVAVLGAAVRRAARPARRVRNLDPTSSRPSSPTNLTLIIQGLIVLFVGADVYPDVVLRSCAAAEGGDPRAGGAASSRPSSVDGCRMSSRDVGWAGIALGLARVLRRARRR